MLDCTLWVNNKRNASAPEAFLSILPETEKGHPFWERPNLFVPALTSG